MAISNSAPVRFTPRGLADAFDASDAFLGACQRLQNLIFDSSNPELCIPRPGVTLLVSLTTLGFVQPAFISIQAAVGTRIYGMVATARNPGRDEPFCYDTATQSVVAFSGVTAANTPVSPGTTGDWTPPTMASIGVYIIVTHPGFSGIGANFFGVMDLTNPAAPVWSSANTAANGLTAVPTAVANLNNRAWYAVGNQLQYSDVLLPLARASAGQALTVGDTAIVNALAGLPMQTTSSGVLAALTALKQTQTWQVTGDPTTNNLALNFLSLTVGTNSPRTVTQSTLGVYFLSTGGPYFIDPLGTLRALTYRVDNPNPDLQTPFINALTPTRWAGGYTANLFRVCGPTALRGVAATNDYWFDEHKRRWNGPHTFQYDCASSLGGYFVLSSANNPGVLLQSQASPQLSSVYTDLGSPYTVTCLSATFPKVGDMCHKQVAESQIELGGAPRGAVYTITAEDEQGNDLDSVTITVPAGLLLLWGSVAQGGTGTIWGSGALWASQQSTPPRTYAVPWNAPLVFEKLQLSISAEANANVQIGTFYARYQKTGYMTMSLP